MNRSHHRPMRLPDFHNLRRLLGCVALVMLLWGCSGRQLAIPEGWAAVNVGPATLDRSVEWISPGGPTEPVLQVIVAHGPHYAVHTALRLQTDTGEVLFWDPGGAYGVRPPYRSRTRDLLIDDSPTLPEYWAWSQKMRSIGLEVFEWNMTAEESQQLGRILKDGAAAEVPKGEFRTSAVALACSRSVSGFLHDFAPERMRVPETYFFPDDLSEALWAAVPDVVYLYRSHQPVLRCTQR